MVCPPLLWCSVQGGHVQYPTFAPDTQFFAPSSSEVAEMFFYSILLFVILYLLVQDCPRACTGLFLVPYGFFEFCVSRRGVSRCKLCSTAAKGPSQISGLS